MDIFKKRRELADVVMSYQKLFDSVDGKRVLADLMKIANFSTSAMDENPYNTAFNEGKREIVLRILNHINADPEKILEIMKDNHKE